MRTTLDLDDDVVGAAMRVSPGMTKTAVIEEALRWYARRRSLAQFADLRGKVKWEGNLDELRGRIPAPESEVHEPVPDDLLSYDELLRDERDE